MESENGDSDRPLTEAAFEIAQWVILSAYIDQETNAKIVFEIVRSSKFIAAVKPNGGNFEIQISEGASSSIVDVIAQIAASHPLKDFLAPDNMQALGIRDEETAWDFVFIAAMVFISLHEAAHCVGGHLSLLTDARGARGTLSFSENERRLLSLLATAADEMSLQPIDVSRMMEFEADGMAADLIYTDLFEILNVFEDYVPLPVAPNQSCLADVTRLATLAMIIVIGLIERNRLRMGQSGPSLHPLPLARMLNITGRRLRHLERNGLVAQDEDAAIVVNVEDPEEFVGIARDAFWLMMVVDRAMGAPVFHAVPEATTSGNNSSFIADLQAYLSGQPPSQTEAGAELSRLASNAGSFLRHLKSHRLCDFWAL